MKKFSVVLAIFGLMLVTNLAQAEHGGPVHGTLVNGLIFIDTGGVDIPMGGWNFESPDGFLVPAADASPFQFLLSNTNTQVAPVNLGTTVTVNNLQTTIGWTGTRLNADGTLAGLLIATWVDATFTANSFLVTPEPTSALLAIFGVLGLLGFRRRR